MTHMTDSTPSILAIREYDLATPIPSMMSSTNRLASAIEYVDGLYCVECLAVHLFYLQVEMLEERVEPKGTHPV